MTSAGYATVADLRVPGCREAAFVRSPVSHADLRGVDTGDARTMPGVDLVLTAGDLTGVGDVPTLFGGDDPPVWRPLADDRVRHVGEPVALVVADDRYRAEDAAGAVRLDLAPRPGRPTTAAALAAGEPLYDGRPDVTFEKEFGPRVAASTWARAHVVVEADLREQLLAPTSLEARAILVAPGPGDALTVWCSHQYPHGLRTGIAGAFGLAEDAVRVVVPDAGGAFGSKSPTYPEYLAVVAAARRLGAPVRWIEDRTESLHAASRGRGQDQHVRLAADAAGRILAIDLTVDADVGAHPLGAALPGQTGLAASGAYDVAEVHAHVRSILTTTAPTYAYRGAGRPEAAYAVERGVDLLAAELGIDPVDLRRRNLVRAFPHDTPTGRRYDSGDYDATLDRALELLEPQRWREEQRRRRADPHARPLGIGVACYVERSGGEPGILEEYGAVRACPDGSFEARVGTSSTGQSHARVFGDVVARRLGVDAARVRVLEADTDEVPEGHGSFASRSAQMGGAALHEAAGELLDRARVAGVGIDALGASGPVEAEHRFSSPPAFPYGAYAAVVEVDPELGAVTVLRLVAVDDYGTVLDPAVVHGQTLGSIAQGLGQVLYEDVPLDADGAALLDEGLLDYLMPTAAEIPPLRLAETAVPNPNNPLGVKGAGEAGCIGVPPAVVNAVVDALPDADPTLLQMPLTPNTVWVALRAGRPPRRSGPTGGAA